jgi:hypothetical protein
MLRFLEADRSAWAELGNAVRNDPVVRANTKSVAKNRTQADPLNQRFAFWDHYANIID